MTINSDIPSIGLDFARSFLLYAGQSPDEVFAKISRFHVEVPSWGFSRGGTRFGVYLDGTEAQTIEEKIADAALTHRLTGATPTVALHFPWDGGGPGDYDRLKKSLRKEGIRAGAINSNSFSVRPDGALDFRLRLGSLTNPFPDVRAAAIEHHRECIDIMRTLDSKLLSVWLADGTNSPGQGSFFDVREYLIEGLSAVYADLREDEWMLVEYKFFEPGFYSTAIPDWGTAYTLCQAIGPRAKVLVDLGHHPLGVNIEQVVSHLAMLGRLGGFHFNDKKYGDDDLASGSIDPYQLFRIFATLVEADARGSIRIDELAFMIDESHMIKHPVEEMLESVEALQRAYVQALAVNWQQLAKARSAGDPSAADAILRCAFQDTPVTAILSEMRNRKSLACDPWYEFQKLRADGKIRGARAVAHRQSSGLGS
jgi:L-rhamnose isomerase / sugar isomerase